MIGPDKARTARRATCALLYRPGIPAARPRRPVEHCGRVVACAVSCYPLSMRPPSTAAEGPSRRSPARPALLPTRYSSVMSARTRSAQKLAPNSRAVLVAPSRSFARRRAASTGCPQSGAGPRYRRQGEGVTIRTSPGPPHTAATGQPRQRHPLAQNDPSGLRAVAGAASATSAAAGSPPRERAPHRRRGRLGQDAECRGSGRGSPAA